jgi:DNA-directed RNA polymerase specialized sigma24 family protein
MYNFNLFKMADNEELTRLRAEEREIWNRINNEFHPSFISKAITFRHITLEDAEDVFQETLSKFHQDAELDRSILFKTGLRYNLFTRYRNRLIDLQRKKESQSSIWEDAVEISEYADKIAVLADDGSALRIALFKKCFLMLPERYRNFIYLCVTYKGDMETLARKSNLKNANQAYKKRCKIKRELLRMMEEMGDL